MAHHYLVDIIKQRLQQGVTKAGIWNELVGMGKPADHVEQAFKEIEDENQTNSSGEPGIIISQRTSIVKKILIGFGLAILLAGLTGGGVFAYMYLNPKPEVVLAKMMDQLPTIQSLSYQGSFRTKFEGPVWNLGLVPTSTEEPLTQKGVYVFSLVGDTDISRRDNPRASLRIRMKAESDTGADAFDFDAQAIFADKLAYLNFGQVPNLGFFDLSKMSNQWIKIDGQSPLAMTPGANPSLLPDKDKLNKLWEVYRSIQLIKITQELPREKIGEVEFYHYQFVIEKENLKSAFVQASKIMNDYEPSEEEIKEFERVLKDSTFQPGEIWINRDTQLPYRIKIQIDSKDDLSKVSTKTTMDFKVDSINQPVNIETPKEYKSSEEMMGEILGGVLENESSTDYLIVP